jgi:hypothetical protein
MVRLPHRRTRIPAWLLALLLVALLTGHSVALYYLSSHIVLLVALLLLILLVIKLVLLRRL